FILTQDKSCILDFLHLELRESSFLPPALVVQRRRLLLPAQLLIYAELLRHLLPERRSLFLGVEIQESQVILSLQERLVLMLSVDIDQQARRVPEHTRAYSLAVDPADAPSLHQASA